MRAESVAHAGQPVQQRDPGQRAPRRPGTLHGADVALVVDLHGVPVLLLGFASLVILWLYRLPRQLA